jgi:hypothetical protein
MAFRSCYFRSIIANPAEGEQTRLVANGTTPVMTWSRFDCR